MQLSVPSVEEFKDAIFKGLGNACDDSFYLCGEPGVKIKPEYIVTVNVAKTLFQIDNSGYGSNFKVRLEEKTSEFATACVLHRRDLFYKHKNSKDTKRPGNIDIAVYDQTGNIPVCAIEVKDFIIYETDRLEADINRNIELINLTHDTGEISTINFAFLAFLREHVEKRKKCVYKSNKEPELRAIENEYRDKFHNLINTHPEIRFTIEARTVAEDLLDDDVNPSDWETEYDFAETTLDKYHYVGVVITTEKINP